MTKILCIYHEDCVDGFLAAWAVGKFFGFDNVQFHPTAYDEAPPDMHDRIVYIVDFAYKPAVIAPYARLADQVTVIDHHKTSLVDWENAITKDPSLKDVIDFQHDTSVSGAVLTWNYFFGHREVRSARPMPYLFRVAQDHDLYQLEMHKTKEIIAAIKGSGMILHQNWQQLTDLVKSTSDMLTRSSALHTLEYEGEAIMKAEEVFILNTLRRNMGKVKFGGYIVPMCAFPHQYATEAGKIMCAGYPFAITYEDRLARRERKFSLRSDKETGIDVELLARRMGGGGHPNAAGFTVPLHHDLGTYIQFL